MKGTKLICINDSISEPLTFSHFQQWIVEGQEYTVRHYRAPTFANGKGAYLLNEVKNEPVFFSALFGKLEPGFAVDRFRVVDDVEIVEKKSEIVETLK